MSFTPNSTPLPSCPFSEDTTEAVSDARRLHAHAERLRAHVAEVGVHGRAAFDELQAARIALAEQQAKPERDPKAEIRLAESVRTHEILSDPVPFRQRSQNAAGAAESAVLVYRSYIRDHAVELLRELEPDAIETAKKLAKALDALAPLQAARAAVGARVSALTECLAPEGAVDHDEWWHIDADERKPPMPEHLEWCLTQIERERNPVEPEALTAGDGTWTFAS